MATIISVSVRASLVSLEASSVRRSILHASTPRLRSLKPAALSFRASSSSQKINIVAEEAAPKKTGRGITKPKPVSPALQDFLGVKEIPRTQALKQIWAYIKERNLQLAFLHPHALENQLYGPADLHLHPGFICMNARAKPYLLIK